MPARRMKIGKPIDFRPETIPRYTNKQRYLQGYSTEVQRQRKDW